ncbi:hypothetical protein F5J12DRAFT_838219 [Pisolithus orientalis]|uniref:uncharacterized protein n=1 Tax=Pisolithus orientalis TaxID=936130 RepID=UPI0022240DD1|nr:uncharacterized protein F5J12DRAFT_838219 [Pisolithus orientalis]KAI6003491.1 hypothetical protein F5J12DRAFT_838219 [Pisolithus orientalis]
MERYEDMPSARGSTKNKLRAPSSSFTGRSARQQLSPYRKCYQHSSPQVPFMRRAFSGVVHFPQSADGGAGKVEEARRKTARTELEQFQFPSDVLRVAVMAQYADCEATRYRIIAATWEIERLERWKRFFDRSLNYLQEKNTTSVSRFEFFKKCCLDLGGRDAAALGAMQKDFKDTEEVAISLGVLDESEESQSFYFGVTDSGDTEDSNPSDTEIPGPPPTSDPPAPPTSDPEVPYTSDLEGILFPTEDSECNCITALYTTSNAM